MRIVFANWPGAEYQGRILTELGAVDRLLSYWELKGKDENMLPSYMQHGHYKRIKLKVNGYEVSDQMPLTVKELERQRKK